MKAEIASDLALSGVASKVTYGGAGLSIYGWVLTNEFAIGVGILATLVGMLVNTFFKWRADRRADIYLKAKLDRLKKDKYTMTDLAALGEDD